jgi:hypothetical protein
MKVAVFPALAVLVYVHNNNNIKMEEVNNE